DDDGALLELGGDGERGVEGEARRAADEDALLAGEPPCGDERLAVVHLHHPVDDGHVHGRGHEVLTDSLDDVRGDLSGVDRPHRVGADDLEGGALLFEVAPDPRDGAAGSDAGDEVADASTGLLPYLWGGGA